MNASNRPVDLTRVLPIVAFAAAALSCAAPAEVGGPTEAVDEAADELLAAVGPTSPVDGFPTYYQDSNGLRLGRCLDPLNPLCGIPAGSVPNPNAPISFPSNYPVESFWMSATANMATSGNGKALLVLLLEATFANGARAVPGEQIAFARLRFRIDNLVPGATYTIKHPYGVDVFRNVAGGRRGINSTTDVGLTPGVFTTALGSRVGPFLRWNPPASAPAGFLGDPAVPHAVTGSPFGTNVFRIEGPNIGQPGSPFLCDPKAARPLDCIETKLFNVVGTIAP